MKRIKYYVLLAALSAFAATCLTACSSFNNMSDEDAYNVGYGLGTAARYLIDN